VTTVGSHSHVGSQALVDVFMWQLFPDGLQGDFQLISRLGVGWSLFYSSSMAFQMSNRYKSREFCMTLETLRNLGLSSLTEYNLVIFTKLCGKV